jgi:hypothetical protein
MKSKKNRRGILLLLILALLAMFGMVVVAFVVLSSQSLRSTKVGSGQERIYHPPVNDANEAAMQALRGTANPISKVKYHSLLEDMYGHNSVRGVIMGAMPVCGGQLTEITTSIGNLRARIGSVLTITGRGSPACGLSTRIVGLNPAPSTDPRSGNPQIVAFPNILPANVGNAATAANTGGLVGCTFIVNDMPFSGTGFGYIQGAAQMSMSALRPFGLRDGDMGDMIGGANEDFDAVDLQNMLLATPPIGNRIIPSLHRPALVNHTYWTSIYPMLSNFTTEENKWKFILHPVDVYYKEKTIIVPPTTTPPTTAEWMVWYVLLQKRPVIGRPLSDEHPNFNGSNPTSLASFYHTTQNRPFAWECGDIPHWDVDTDGDGIPDAIWIDIGLTVRATPDGRKYKPLVAYYVLDMDGRFNFNAHGSLAQTQLDYGLQHATNALFPDFSAEVFAGGMLPTRISRGSGFGPAEIDLAAILPKDFDPGGGAPHINFYQRVLGIAASNIEGRYGFDGVPGDNAPNATPSFFTGLGVPSNAEQRKYNDELSANKWYEFDGLRDSISGTGLTAATAGNIARLAVNAALPDPSGKFRWGLDPTGRPIMQGVGLANQNVVVYGSLPYETNLGLNTSRGLPSTASANDPPDNPFSVNELERILRPFDRDMQSQSTRLAELTRIPGTNKSLLNFDPTTLNRNLREHEVTTESWDVPVYNAGLPDYILQYMRNHLGDIGLMVNYRRTYGPPITGPVPDWIKPKKITDVLTAYLYYQLVNPPPGAGYTALPAEDDPPNNVIGARSTAEKMVAQMTPADLLSLFPPELLAGLKMNVNHAFPGYAEIRNGTKYNYDLAVLWQTSGMGSNFGQIWFGQMPNMPFPDPNSTIISPGAPFATRQLYARYLYVLALLLREPGKTAEWFAAQPTLSPDDKEKLTKRRIAQWAINVAGYKANDSIMVPFEYHLNPLGVVSDTNLTPPYRLLGWQYLDTADNKWKNLDGIVALIRSDHTLGNTPDPNDNSTVDDTQANRRLVWGCKPPEVVLTETFAVHNRRIADTNWEQAGGMKTDQPNTTDPDYDQVRVPQGSAFFELYACRDLHGTMPPADLYDPNSGSLDLGKRAPPDNDPQHTVPAYPVWRMVISESRFDLNPNDAWHNDVRDRLLPLPPVPTPQTYTSPVAAQDRTPDTASIEPEQFHGELGILSDGTTLNPNNADRMRFSMLADAPVSKVGLDRIVWFTNMAPTTHLDADRVFWNRSTPSGSDVLLPRGRYAVVGPRAFTRFGLTTDKTDLAHYPLGTLALQTITMSDGVNLDNNLVSVTDINGTIDANNVTTGPTKMIKAPLTIIAAGGGPGTSWPPGWTQTNTTAPMGIGVNISEPLFSQASYYPEPTVAPPATAGWPTTDNIMEWYGDPQVGQDPNSPNITKYFLTPRQDTLGDKPLGREMVDGQPLAKYTGTFSNYKTVFLQRLANPSAPFDALRNPYLTVDWMPIDLTVFTGDDAVADAANPNRLNDFADSTTLQMQYGTRQRGLLPSRDPNCNFWAPVTDDPDIATHPTPTGAAPNLNYDLFVRNRNSLGYLNYAYWNTADMTNPWITEANRGPRPNEYIGDPLTGTGTLHPFPWMPWFGRPYVNEMELMMVPTSCASRMLWEFQPCAAFNGDHYNPVAAMTAPNFYAPTSTADQAFPQLPNFFEQSTGGRTMMPFYPLLDYLGVPSWYAGAEIQANPSLAYNDTLYPSGNNHWFHTPYNRISNYREPGRINLNTDFSQNVFTGLMNSVPAPNWADLVDSRRGDGATTGNIFTANAMAPTDFAAPFRSSSGAQWSLNPAIAANPIQTTLLRAGGAGGGGANSPLFMQNSPPTNDVENPYRNPYFLYSDVMRMRNLTTTRSNVYAMWVTVGYFEVTPAVPVSLNTGNVADSWMFKLSQQSNQPSLQSLMGQAYPDGYQIGQELGSDTGKITRHRAFYIIDRSIPVGFERGQDLNVEKAILLKRIIE